MKIDSCFKKIEDDRLPHSSPHDEIINKGMEVRRADNVLQFHEETIAPSLGTTRRCRGEVN